MYGAQKRRHQYEDDRVPRFDTKQKARDEMRETMIPTLQRPPTDDHASD